MARLEFTVGNHKLHKDLNFNFRQNRRKLMLVFVLNWLSETRKQIAEAETQC